uniref:Iso_dh domain-containing protein n=1 Tax=Wuchereria bancrofti TaxID=6293 RepID=A0A1I8ERQ7_WUCBA
MLLIHQRLTFLLVQTIKRCASVRGVASAIQPQRKMKVTVIPGDGVGVELTHAVQKIVQSTGIPLEFEEVFLSEIQHSCSANLEEVIKSVRKNNNVALKGAIKEADETVSNPDREDINRALKKGLDLFAGVSNIKSLNGIRTRHQKNLDFVIIREQTEGEYSSLEHELIPGVVECLKITTEEKSYRIAKFAFDYATKFGRHKVTAIHKANIMKLGDGLFLRNCEEVIIFEPGARHAYQQAFGKQIANPTAMILCCADLLQHLRLQKYGAALRSATEAVVAEGKIRTRDLGGCSSTLEFTDAVIQKKGMKYQIESSSHITPFQQC